MSPATAAASASPGGAGRIGPQGLAATLGAQEQRIPGAFQFLLALYIILTGDLPTIIQALAFGLPGGGEAEFAAAMVTSIARDALLLVPVLALSKHPLGILHPLILAVVLWPLLVGMPKVIEQYGGWAGILAGSPVATPFFIGLRSLDPSTVWTAVAKYNAVLIVALVCTYAGFFLVRGGRSSTRIPSTFQNTLAFRTVLIGLFGLSVLVLLVFLYFRGGLGEHLTSLGRGRFRELSGTGPVVVIMDLGAIAVYLWIAARPGDAKSPLFLGCLAAVTVTQFVSTGSRGSALTVPLVAGIIWALRHRTVPWRLGLLLLPFMFVSLGLLGAVRTSSWYGSTAGEAWSATGWTESLERAQTEMVERRQASAHVPVVARGFDVTDGPMLGQTYIAAVAAWIPRAIWEGKPRAAGSIYSQTFLGESKEGAAIPVSPPAEAYWNFGWPGVVLLSILYGLLLRAAYHFFWRRYPNPFAIVFLVLFVTTFHISSRDLVRFEQRMGLLFICYAAVSIAVPRATAGAGNRVLARAAGP